MSEKQAEMTLRNCFDRDGRVMGSDTQYKEHEPLRELLEMFESLHKEDTGAFEKAG